MENIYIRINGRGNAWPVFVGSSHPFYSSDDPDDLGNASYSIIGSKSKTFDTGQIDWELLIDAGNNTVSYIIRNENRIPEAIILTHPHMDHSLGVDWIAQSYVHLNNFQNRYPLYATRPCWEYVRKSYQQLDKIIDFHELVAGVKIRIENVPQLFVTPFPVYHGESGFGASLLLFEHHGSGGKHTHAVITGDMLCPLLRKEDYKELSKAGVMYIDCNNRFSYPLSNHGSITAIDPRHHKIADYLIEWQKKADFEKLFAPHLQAPVNKNVNAFFKKVVNENKDTSELIFSITELLKKTEIPFVKLVHYGGFEDKKHYQEKIMNDRELEKWANKVAVEETLTSKFMVPKTGDVFKLV